MFHNDKGASNESKDEDGTVVGVVAAGVVAAGVVAAAIVFGIRRHCHAVWPKSRTEPVAVAVSIEWSTDTTVRASIAQTKGTVVVVVVVVVAAITQSFFY